MPDANKNGLPDSWESPLAAILTLIGLVAAGLSVYLDPLPWWLPFTAGLTTAIGGVFRLGLVPVSWPAAGGGAALAFGLALAFGATGCTNAAWKATGGVRTAGNMVDRGVAAASKHDREACKAKHQPKTEAFRKCYRATRGFKALKGWRQVALKVVNTGLVTTVTTLTVVEKTKEGPLTLADALPLLQPIACAIDRYARQWKAELGNAAIAIRAAVAAFKGVCP